MSTIDLTGYRLTFDDEFNTRSISLTGAGTTWADRRAEWHYGTNADVGFGQSSFLDPSSGYDPFRVSGGALTITAMPPRTVNAGVDGSWQSGLITTQGGFSQTYGYFEIRANYSAAPGAWDAFWLMPDHKIPDPNNAGGWQELDVVEHYGSNPRGVYSTIHTTDPQNGVPWQVNRQVYSEMSTSSGYHTYGMNWQPDYISFYVDGQYVGRQATPSDMHGPMYLIANLATQAVAGEANNANLAGVPISSSIDYIRVYSNAPNAVAVAQQAISAPDGHDPGLHGATALAYGVNMPSAPTMMPSDPSLSFSSAGYLAANRDVAASGMNALTHFDTFGWKEGRDPTATFDVQQYLQHNPDVKAAGIDPFLHYLSYGQFEGRQAYAAVGNSASFNHGSFDAEYYLLANPDVATAALASGGDTLAFAYQHYANYGWHENRKAGAYFDPAYYLAHNPDVAAAHVDPLAHYDTFGWKEGRNASADFNTAAYLAANPDVAAAHIDPLTHYLQWGVHEGRHLA